MRKVLIVCLILSGCAAQKCPEACQDDISEMKQERALAQKKLIKQKDYVEKLQEEIARKEIALIRKEISQADQHDLAKRILSHERFYQQREVLNQIIRDNPTCRAEAQEVLDKILTLITQLSEQAYE